MPAKDPKKLNPNSLLIGAVIVILAIIAVYSGRHTKITISRVVSIEANIPDTNNSSKIGDSTHHP